MMQDTDASFSNQANIENTDEVYDFLPLNKTTDEVYDFQWQSDQAGYLIKFDPQ